MPSVNTVMLIFALAALAILALSALVGFLAGLKRELKLTIVFVVLLGLVWLVLGNASVTLDANLPAFATTMLRDALSGMVPSGQLGDFDSLRELIVQVVNGLAAGGSLPANIADLMVEGTKTYALIMSVVDFVVRFALILVGTIVVYVLFIVIRVLSFIIGSIYRLCTIRRRRRKRELKEAKRETGLEEGVVVVKSDLYDGEVVVTLSRNPKKVRRGKRRGWAAGLGLLRGALTVLLICAPITGLLSIVNEVEPETVDMVTEIMGGGQSQGQVSQEDDSLLDWVFEFADAYDKGIVSDVISASGYFLGKDLDVTLFDNLLKIETSTQTIYVREEIIKLVQIANILPEAYDPNKSIPIDIWSLSDVKQDQIFELLKDFKLLYEIMPVAIEFAGSLDMVKDLLEPSGQSLAPLSTVDWTHDLPLILDAVREALELGDITVNFDPLKLDSDVLRVVVANIGATDFIAKLMPIVINAALHLQFVEGIIGEWPEENVIKTDGIVWENEFVNLVDIYALFQDLDLDLSNLDVEAIISDSEKMEIVKEMLTHLFTSDLFLDVLLQVLDVAKEFQLGNLGFEEFKNILKLTNLVAEDWAQDVNTLVDMVVLVEELGVLSEEGIDFYNYDAIKGLITKLFDLMILSNKAGVNYESPEAREVQEVFNEVKTLLVEAALRQFDLFDVEGGFQFEEFTKEERSAIEWENEKQMLLNVVDVYAGLMDFLKTKDITFDNLGDNINNILNYDETFDYLIDLLDALIDSDLAMTLIPYALDKFVTPIIEDLEGSAGLPDGDKIDIADKVNKDNISEEIFNLIYILMDARELGLIGVVTGEMNLKLGALAYNPDSASFKEMSDKLGYAPAADDLALVDIINRVFNSKLFEGNEAKLFRVLFAVFVDTRISKGAINAIEFSDPEVETSERNIIISAINGLRPILDDPEFKLFDDEGNLAIDMDYFVDKDVALSIVDSVRKLFSSQLIAVLLPELYNQYLIPQGIVPEEIANVIKVQSLYLAEHKKDEAYLEGLTGAELTQDIVTVLSIAELLIDFDVLNILAEEADIKFADAADTFDRLFDLVLQLNVLRDNGNELASALVKMLLDAEVPVEKFEELNVNWKEEVQGVKGIFRAVFDLLLNSGIDGYKTLNEVLENPMGHLENFLVDANVQALADILNNIADSKALAAVALPLVNKFVPGMVEGLEEFTEEELSGEMITADIKSLATILGNVAEAKLMATVKAILGEFTDLIEEQDTNVVIPLRHDLYAEIVEELFGLNLLQVESVKAFIVETLSGIAKDIDFSSVDPKALNFAADGKVLADAYRAFVKGFHQDIFANLSVQDILGVINGEKELTEFVKVATQANYDAVRELVKSVLSTTLVKEFALVAFNFAKGLVPEDLAFLVNVELTKDQLLADIESIGEVINSVIMILKPAIKEIKNNLGGILDGTVDILSLELAIDTTDLYDKVETIAKKLDDLYLFDTRGKELIVGIFGLLDIELTEEDLATVVWADEKANVKAAVQTLVNFAKRNDIHSLQSALALANNLSLENTDLINTQNVLDILDIVLAVFNSEFVRSVFGPVYDALLKDMLPEVATSILTFDEEYTGYNFIEEIAQIISGLRSIVSFELIEFVNAQGKLNWQEFNKVSDGIRQIFSVKLLDKAESTVLDLLSESAGLTLVDVLDINWAQTGDQLASALEHFVNAINQAGVLDEMADLETIGEHISAFYNDQIITEFINGLYDLVNMQILEALFPTVINFVANGQMLPEAISELLLMEGLSGADYVADLNTIVSILEDVQNMGLVSILQGIANNDMNSITLRNLDNIVTIFDKVIKLRFWDNKRIETIETILTICGVEVTNELDGLDTAKENQILLDVFRELVSLVDTLFATEGQVVVGDVIEYFNGLDNAEYAKLLNNGLLTIANIFESLSESAYVRVLTAPIYSQLIQPSLEEAFVGVVGEQNTSIVSLDCYLDNPQALSDDLAKIALFFRQLHTTELINIIFDSSFLINYGQLRYLADAVETIFSLEILASKEAVIVDILNYMAEGYVLSDGNIDFSKDCTTFKDIINTLLDFANSGVVCINTFADVELAMSGQIQILYENLLCGGQPAIKLVFDALKTVGKLTFLDEVFAFAHNLVKESVTLPEGLEFLIELGPNGTPGLVGDYVTIITAVEDIFDLGYFDLLIGKDVKIEFAATLAHVVDSFFNLDFFQGKGDKVIEYAADMIEYPGLAEELPHNWAAENEAFANIFYQLESIMYEWGLFYVSDFGTFVNSLVDMNAIVELFSDNVLEMLRSIAGSVVDSIVVQATLGAAVYFALPLVEASLPENMQPLVRLDDITVGELVEDVMSIVAIVADFDNFNLFGAILFGEDLVYDAPAYKEPNKYAVAHVFETLFGLNYINAKLDTIAQIVSDMNPDFAAIDFEFLQSEALVETYSVELVGTGMSNFAYDGVKLAQMYTDLVDTVFTDPKWSLYSFNDFGSIQILEDFYSRNIINGLVDAIAQLLDLNTIQAALPYAYDLLGNMFAQNDFGFIVEYVLETPADELQEDIVTIISSLKALADNHEFIYEEDLRNFIYSGNLGYLNFNLSTVQALPDILNNLSKLNVLSYVKGERLVEIIKYVLNVALPTFDQTNIDWAPISEMLNYAGSEFEELTAFVEAFDILAKILYEDVQYTEFKELYNDLYSIRISQNERLLNADVVNSVLDIAQIFVDSSLVESFFYAVYDNFLAATVEGMTPVNQLLDVYKYGSVVELQEDLTAILNIVRELVKFDALGIAFFGRDIEWTNTEPIENIFRNLFGLNYLEADAGLPLIVEFLNEMVDLSALDVEALGASLEGFGETLALAYRILATDIFATEAFPIHSAADLANIVVDVAKFLEPGILNSALNAVQAIVEADFVEELLEAGFYIAQLNVPDNLFFLVQNQLTGDQLQHDLVSILNIVRELVDAEAYNIMLQGGKVALDGIADHLITIVDLLVHTNLISNDPNNFVAGLLGLAGIYVSVDELETVDYQHDLANLYAIFTILEDILDKAKFENHLDIMNFINNLNVNELLYNEDLLCETNLMNVLDILDNIVDLSLIPAIFEPAYNSLVDLNSVSDQIYPFMDLAEYPAELLVEDAKALVNALRNLVDFDVLSIVRGYAINWDNIEAIENVINIIFGLNYLEVKLDDILFFLEDATAGMFNISLVNVENVDLENDGALIAAAYRLLAENVLSENWFPIQYVSDLQTLDLTTLPLDKLVTEAKLTALVQLIENILNTSLVYEGLAVAYDFLQNNINMDLAFVVNASLSKDQLHEDAMTIVYILREAIATKFYNTFQGKAIPLAGLTDHVENILRALFGINFLEGRLNDLLFNGLMLTGLPVDQSLVEEIDMDQELETIYAILGIVDDILRQSEFKYDTDITNFLNSIQSINDITSNDKVFSNSNLLSVLEILENIVSLELIHVLYEPVIYATGILDSLSNDIYPLLDISEYSSDMLVEDLESVISVLRSVVRFDVLSVLRGYAINWANIEDVENIFIQLFGLNYLEVKLDDILFYFSAFIPELLEIEVDGVNLAADGEKIAKAYRLIAENVLTQSWFPIQFLNDALTGTATLHLDEALNDATLNGIVDALAEILHTTLVYEALPVAYSFGQTNIPADLYFLVANSLTKEELAEDVDAIILVLREVIASGAYNFAINKGVEIEGLARHISTILDTLLHTNILGNDYAYLFENVFGLVGLPVSSDDLETVNFEQDFASIYAVLENIEDVFVRAKYETHLDVLSFLNSIQSFDYIINNRDLVNDENAYELIDSLDLLIDLTLVEALIEPLYDQFVQLDSFDATMQVLLDMSNYGKELLIADLHTLVDVLRQAVKFGAIDILRGEEINFANTQPIETIINSLFGLNYLETKLQDIVNLVTVEGLDTSLIDADLIVENLEADGLVVAKAYSNIAKNILARADFPGKTVEAIMNLTLDELKEFYSKDLALEFISYVRPLVDMVLTGEALEVAYNFAQYVVPSEFAYLLEQSLTKGDLANDVHSVIDIVEVLIESDLIKLAFKKDIPLAGISAAINEIIDIVVHTNIFGRDLARVFEGTLALAGLEVAYDDLAKVNYKEDFKVIYSIVEDVEAILINSKFETVLGAVDGLKDAIASGTAVLRNKDLVNDANVLAVLDILVKVIDLEVLTAVGTDLYPNAIQKVVNEFDLPVAITDTNRYAYADLISDAKLGIDMARELVAFGVIGYFQDNTEINFANTTPIENIINKLFTIKFLNEFDKELIKFAGEQIGIDFSDVDVDSINWQLDAAVFAEAYVTVATRILADAEFPVKRYSDIRSFEFNAGSYAKERYALAGIDALDLLIDTTIFDAFGLFLLDYANNNVVPEDLRFVINEANLNEAELRLDAHAILSLAESAIKEGFGSLVTDKDCDINKPDFYKEVIEVLFDLHIVEDAEIRSRLINYALDYASLEQIVTIYDWDYEEVVYKLLVDKVCEFLASQDLATAKKLYSFAINKEFMTGAFLSDANLLEILDIAEVAVKSELVSKVSASVYTKVINELPYEGVKDLLAFGTGARDYTKDGFYDDLPQLIVIAREMINLHMLDVIRVHNWEIASSAQINKLIDEVMKLNVLEGRLDLFADFVFSQVEVEVVLTDIDWENEIEVLQNVITLALPALKDSGMIMLSDAKALAQEILASPVDFVKNNRAYMNLTNAYVALDVLTELGNSEVYMRSILPLYNRVSAQLPAVVTENIDLTTYPELELRDDYADVLAIARYGLDGKLYKALSERRAWEFPVEAVDALEKIIEIATELNFTARYTEGIFKVAGSLLGIDLPTNLDEIYLAQDKEELVSIVSSAREIWIGTNHIRPNIPMFANTSLFEEISFVLDTLLDTTVANVFAPWAYEVYAVEVIANIPDLDGNMNLTKLQSYVGQQVIDLFEDGIVVLNELIAMGVFSSTGIDFSDNTHVEAIVDILLEHVEFSSKFENYIVKATERAYLMGVIPTAYEDVESTRGELSLIKSIATSAIDLLGTYGSSLASSDFAALVDGTCEAEVLAIIDKVNESVLLNAAFIPAMNGFGDVVMGPEFAGIYEACQVATVLEFKDAVAGLFDILEQANNVGILSKHVQYKNTDGIKALIQLIEHSPFFQGQEGVLAEFVLRHTDYIDHNEVDLISINWANEYQYLYAFLDKANAPLNMEGIVINEYRALLENELFIKDFTDALRELAPSELMVEMFMPVYENIVVKKVPVVGDYLDYSHFDSLSESEYEAAVSAEYLSVLDLLVAISASGLMNDTNLVNLDSLLDVYDIVFALEGTKNNKADIFTKLSDKLPSFGDSELVIPSDVNWDTEIPAIRGIFASLENFADVDGNINISEIGNVITESTDVKAFEDLLTAVNHSVIYREQVFNTLNSEINNLGSDGDITISNYLTDWFKDQTEHGMLGIAEWEDEMIYIARILTIINYMRQHGGISDFGSMTLGDGTEDNAVTIATDDFNVADYGLKQLLQLMSASDSFTLTALNNDLEVLLVDNAEHDGVIKTDKHINALNDAEWDAEINDLITLLHNIQVLGVLDNADFAGSIASFTTTEVEELLSSFNHCEVIRPLLPDLIASTLDSAGATDWKSEWLAEQVGVDGLGNNKPMATESAWDLEASELASMISLVDGFDFNKGISEYTDTEINALRELLHAMNHSQSLDVTYIITFLNANVLENDLIETDKRFEKPNPDWSVNKWDDQLDKMVDVIDACVSNGLFESNSGDALANLEEAQIKAILQTVNASEIMRTVLPDLVYSAVQSAGQTSWLTQDKWLENQTGVDGLGNNKPVADAAIWDDEIEQYAYIISAAQDPEIDFTDLDLTNNVTLVKIELILAAMNKTRSFTLDPITDIINDILASYQYNVQLLGVMDGADKDYTDDTNGTNKDEWADELHVLMTIVDQMNNLGAITADTLKDESTKLGILLNTMRFSYLFGNDVRDDDIAFDSTDDDNMFNELVLNVLDTSGLMKNGSTGLIDPVQAAADDWTHYDWQKELAILSAFDTNATSQTDEFIGDAQDSEIIENYFDIAGEINSRIDVDFTILSVNYNLKTLVEAANGGPLTNANLRTRNWASEIADINTLNDAIAACGNNVTLSTIATFVSALATVRTHQTLAGKVANTILTTAGF